MSFGTTYDELRDYLLFDFDNCDDIRLFLHAVHDGMNLSVHVCLEGTYYIMDNTEQW